MSANDLNGVQHGLLQQRNCLQEITQRKSNRTNPSPHPPAIRVAVPGSSRGRCVRAPPTDTFILMLFATGETPPETHTKPRQYQASVSSKGTGSCWPAVTSSLLFAAVQTVSEAPVTRPYVAPRKKAVSERPSKTHEEQLSDLETSKDEQVRDFRVSRLSLRFDHNRPCHSMHLFDVRLHVWLRLA